MYEVKCDTFIDAKKAWFALGRRGLYLEKVAGVLKAPDYDSQATFEPGLNWFSHNRISLAVEKPRANEWILNEKNEATFYVMKSEKR